jgi:hypothetical protein
LPTFAVKKSISDNICVLEFIENGVIIIVVGDGGGGGG